MGVFRRTIRLIAYCALGLFAAYLALAAALHIQQYVLRRRAERLLADVQSLRVRQATFDQAQEVFAHWRSWGSYDLPCSRENCHFSIALDDLGRMPGTQAWYEWAFCLYRSVGSRLAAARASIWVRDGVVSRVSFELEVYVYPFVDASGRTVSYPLIGRLRGVSRLEPDAFSYGQSHPEYKIGGPSGCTSCVMIWFTYSPYAPAADLRRAGEPNFACITAWRPCRTKGDIMPGAMAQVAVDGSWDANDVASCNSRVVATISRDAANVAVAAAEVVARKRGYVLKVRLLKRLKRSDFLEVGSTYDLGVVQDVAIAPLGKVSTLHSGSRVIIVFDQNPHPDPRAVVPLLGETCGVIPFSAPVLQLVQDGILRDNLPPWSGNPNLIYLETLRQP